MSPAELIQHKEESLEMGGYFIVNGNEKVIRLLVVPKRNHPLALIRGSFANRGSTYSQYGIQIRCARRDETSLTNVLHYLNDGNVMLRFSWRKVEYLLPVMMVLNALVETNDKAIFDGITAGRGEDPFLSERVESLLRTFKTYHLFTRRETLAYLGSKFRVVFEESEDLTDEEIGEVVLHRVILVHLPTNADKVRLLMYLPAPAKRPPNSQLHDPEIICACSWRLCPR
jgi:DNA-directed RNA polymerase I subunit RPA2